MEGCICPKLYVANWSSSQPVSEFIKTRVYGVQITDKGLSPVLELQSLKELALVGCPGIDDESLKNLKQGSKSLEVHLINVIFTCFDQFLASTKGVNSCWIKKCLS